MFHILNLSSQKKIKGGENNYASPLGENLHLTPLANQKNNIVFEPMEEKSE